MKYIIIAIVCLMMNSCAHKHESGHAHDVHGNHVSGMNTQEIPRVDYTRWSSMTELFVEFPVLIKGKQSRFAAHFTVLDGHQAVTEGEVTVSLMHAAQGIRHNVKSPSSPGIFAPVLEPIQSGIASLQFVLVTADYTDTLTIENVMVYADEQSAYDAHPQEEEGSSNITFLKEQAWKMPFQTEVVRSKSVYETFSTSGIWDLQPNTRQSAIAHANGRVYFAKKDLLVGGYVRKGEVIMSISGDDFATNNVSGHLKLAEIDYQQAKEEYHRKKALYAEKIVPQAEMEIVEQKFQAAKATYEAIANGYSASGYTSSKKQIVAPTSGYLRHIFVSNGSYVKEGDRLCDIGAKMSNTISVRVPLSYSNKLDRIHNIWYRNPKGEWKSMKQQRGHILSIDKDASEINPTITLLARMGNDLHNWPGSNSEVCIAFGDQQKGIVIPKSALLEDYGNYSTIVQLSGESFERRNVVLGTQSADDVEIVKGLSAGEVIVTTGAYQVKMQSMSGQAPAHGHAH